MSTTCVAECLKQIESSKRDERKSSGMGVWEPVIRKEMDAGGAKAVSLRWVDTDKGDADRPNYRS